MNIFAFIIGLIVVFLAMIYASVLVFHNKSKKPQNKVHFYVTRDSDESLMPNSLILWIGKPDRLSTMWNTPYDNCTPICVGQEFGGFELDSADFKDLKFEDEPVEVFLNLEE